MRRTTAGFSLAALAILCITSCSSGADAPPPGLAAHQSLAAKGGLAAKRTGSCHQFTIAEIRNAFGGHVSAPVPDTLTPGLDRCNWTITNSDLAKAAIELIVYRPINAASYGHTPSTRVTASAKSTQAPGASVTYDPSTRTLTTTRAGQRLSLQLVTTAHTKISAADAKRLLTQLTQQG